MRASTLLSITAALILALGTAIGARALGLFERKPAAAKSDPVIKILVARTNLYEGIPINPNMVMVRDLRPDELDDYNKNRDKYLAARVEAAALRTPIRNIEADTPIRRTDLQDIAFPDGLPLRLSPNTRAVNVLVPKERSAGGLITVGHRVDVLLTSRVCDGQDCSKGRTLSAFIARNLRVIVKRNQLWQVLRPNPEGEPIAYTLEANPYRAALIEFANNKGNISLLPSAASRIEKTTPTSGELQASSFSVPGSPEYQDEDDRVERVLRGDYSITEADLERIFRLRPIVRTPPAPPPPPPVVVQNIAGVRFASQDVFDRKTGERLPAVPPPPKPKDSAAESYSPVVASTTPWMGYSFFPPDAAPQGNGKPNCPT